jgi:hypothetical protein
MKKRLVIGLVLGAACAATSAHAADIIPRTVAMELFTASWCGYCPAADAAAEQMLSEEGRAGTVFIEYHVSDPLSNGDGTARQSYYGVSGTPTMIFDGISKVIGAGGDMYPTYRQRFDSRRFYSPMVDIRVTGDMTGDTYTIQGSVEVTEQIWQNGTPQIRIMLTENDLWAGSRHYNGVLRDHVVDIPLNGKSVGSVTYINESFTPNALWKKDDLNVVVLLQETQYKEIIGAKRLSEVSMDVLGDSYTVARGDHLMVPISLENISRNDQDLLIWMIAYRTNGQQIGPNPIFSDNYSIASGAAEEYMLDYLIPGGAPGGTYRVAAWIGTSLDDTLEWDTYEVTIQ